MTFKKSVIYVTTIGVLIFCLTNPYIVHSQKFSIGVKTGATVSKSSFGVKDDNIKFTNLWKPGFFAAGLVNFQLKKNFSFQTEGGFSQRGRRIQFNHDTWTNSATYQFLDGSMMLRKAYPLKWTSNIRGTWFFNIGPKVSYWMNGRGKVTSGGSYKYNVVFAKEPDNPDLPDFNTMYLTNINRWLFGIDFGIGVDAPTVALQKFIIELRFTSGHTFYGAKESAFNRTLGFVDNMRANEKIISLSIDYSLSRTYRQSQKGKSTKSKEIKSAKPRRKFDSLLH